MFAFFFAHTHTYLPFPTLPIPVKQADPLCSFNCHRSCDRTVTRGRGEAKWCSSPKAYREFGPFRNPALGQLCLCWCEHKSLEDNIFVLFSEKKITQSKKLIKPDLCERLWLLAWRVAFTGLVVVIEGGEKGARVVGCGWNFVFIYCSSRLTASCDWSWLICLPEQLMVRSFRGLTFASANLLWTRTVTKDKNDKFWAQNHTLSGYAFTDGGKEVDAWDHK